MIRVEVTEDHIRRARENAAKIPETINNSIRGGGGRMIGCLGEILVAEFFGVDLSNTMHHDLKVGGTTVEVKTKERTVDPKPDFNATVANYNPNQKCDYYFFVSITMSKSGKIESGHLCGAMGKEAFYKKAKFCQKGDIDPKSPGGSWKFKADCWNLEYSELKLPPLEGETHA
jgi:hypothetical protein